MAHLDLMAHLAEQQSQGIAGVGVVVHHENPARIAGGVGARHAIRVGSAAPDHPQPDDEFATGRGRGSPSRRCPHGLDEPFDQGQASPNPPRARSAGAPCERLEHGGQRAHHAAAIVLNPDLDLAGFAMLDYPELH
jgi:hypothetical protein